ncbi:MAG: UDP-N-acetylmuramoylalanyl-D-glutamyl-2, 6-diaminopimelate--D-alanyl-D-alanine ligase [Hyphomicrobium sp.]|nr:MAG: UDP-N-acetylmuramoylalanyl-D-glutamyl-2, 6-diaminopimelate--D-alanyl-D-alanine ligase [Hyphomicrobium sp.]PPC99300.1 MAG: UDP-N-acetylmuramoylalanyl-D-glutamyl-2, 6-diaminopimelate--D-alanyl-D-alanine ligase [Hyphomicrobium sp.]
MTAPLWTWTELVAATGGIADVQPKAAIIGVSIDTRSLAPGDLFVALKDQRDGHEFVTTAFKSGAAAAIVAQEYQRQSGDGALIRVADVLHALQSAGRAARARLSANARVVAVTGSAGKTGTKEMLRACLARVGKVHASEKSYNNHWGVPLTLARMPADTQYGVFEIGMNHADEIRPLSKMVRPHAAIITTVAAVHIEHFASVSAIADAKAEIFEGLAQGGTAIVKYGTEHTARLIEAAARCGARGVTFGLDDRANVHATNLHFSDDGTMMQVNLADRHLNVSLAMPGRHIAENALAVIAAMNAVGADVESAAAALATLAPPTGRGARMILPINGGEALLIDESYNANPASMRAALAALATVPRDKFPRRIAVLGDMLELGSSAPDMHRDLKTAVDEAGVNVVFACGPLMQHLYDALPQSIQGGYALSSAELGAKLANALSPGDVVMVKGSNGTRLGPLVTTLKAKFHNDVSARQ